MQGLASILIDFVRSFRKDDPHEERRRASFLLRYPRDLGSRWEAATEAVYVLANAPGFAVRRLRDGKLLATDSTIEMALRLAEGRLTDLQREADGITVSRIAAGGDRGSGARRPPF